MILETALQKIIEGALSIATGIIGDRIKEINKQLEQKTKKQSSIRILDSPEKLTSKIKTHLKETESWINSISFWDLKQSKSLAHVYVHLDTYLIPLRNQFDESESTQREELLQCLVNSPRHAAILGHPGAGKTTSMQKVCLDFFDSGKALVNHNFPIIVMFRDMPPIMSLTNYISQLLGLELITNHTPDNKTLEEEIQNTNIHKLGIYANELNCVLILDGLDEAPLHSKKAALLQEIKCLAKILTKSKILLTCRSGEFEQEITGFSKFEIAPLHDRQIEEFAANWLSFKKAEDFISQLRRLPFYDTARRPLTIAHLCAIYERVGRLPEEPKSVYRKIVNLLIEEWDSRRGVKRETKYAAFTVDMKFEFLCAIAFHLTIYQGSFIFNPETLQSTYEIVCKRFSLPESESLQVANEIESHTGLLVLCGYRKYSFAHKSIQEYLTAEYLVRLPSLRSIATHLNKLPAELAIATTLSSHAGDFLGELALNHIVPIRASEKFVSTYLRRLRVEMASLAGGESAVLGAAALITNYHSIDGIADLLSPIFSKGSSKILSNFYTRKSIIGDESFFFGPISSEYPSRIRIPSRLIQLTN